jgi:hypothetical protein
LVRVKTSVTYSVELPQCASVVVIAALRAKLPESRIASFSLVFGSATRDESNAIVCFADYERGKGFA